VKFQRVQSLSRFPLPFFFLFHFFSFSHDLFLHSSFQFFLKQEELLSRIATFLGVSLPARHSSGHIVSLDEFLYTPSPGRLFDHLVAVMRRLAEEDVGPALSSHAHYNLPTVVMATHSRAGVVGINPEVWGPVVKEATAAGLSTNDSAPPLWIAVHEQDRIFFGGAQGWLPTQNSRLSAERQAFIRCCIVCVYYTVLYCIMLCCVLDLYA
jgi:hypothetical protein